MNSDHIATLELAGGDHWWGSSRRHLLLRTCLRYIDKDWNVLEVGSGSGEFAEILNQNNFNLTIIEPSNEIKIQGMQKQGIKVYSGTFENFNRDFPESRFETILMFDVLEHMKNDIEIVGIIRNLLSDCGIVILTVPSDARLWSQLDNQVGHFRRYEKSMVEVMFKNEGFKIVESRYWLSLLKPLIRLYRKLRDPSLQENLKPPTPIVNKLLRFLMRIENFKLTSMLPGLTILLVAQKLDIKPSREI